MTGKRTTNVGDIDAEENHGPVRAALWRLFVTGALVRAVCRGSVDLTGTATAVLKRWRRNPEYLYAVKQIEEAQSHTAAE